MSTATEKKQMDPKEMMKIYQELGTPGEGHNFLSWMAGTWSTHSRSWAGPGQQPMEDTGMSENTLLYGGRYLQQVLKTTMMGMPYMGTATIAFDNQSKKYISTWIDNMSTGIFISEGTASADGKTITQTSKGEDPIRGPMTFRVVTQKKDDNTFVFQMYGTDKSGKEDLMMETTYTRQR